MVLPPLMGTGTTPALNRRPKNVTVTRVARGVTSPNSGTATRRTGKSSAVGMSGPKLSRPRPGTSVGCQQFWSVTLPGAAGYVAQHTWPSRVAQAIVVQPFGRLLSSVSFPPTGGWMAINESIGVTARLAGDAEWPGNQANVVPRSPTAMLATATHAATAAVALPSRCLRRIH